jgi:hypothetical protein
VDAGVDVGWAVGRATWGTTADMQELLNNMNLLKANCVDKGLPVIVGEYAACGTGKSQEMRRLYAVSITEAAYKRKMCPMLWDTPGGQYNRTTCKFDDPVFIAEMQAIASSPRILPAAFAVWDAPDNNLNGTWPTTIPLGSKNAGVTVTEFVKGAGLKTDGPNATYSLSGSFTNNSQDDAATGNVYFSTTIKVNEGYKMSLTGISTWFMRGSNNTLRVMPQYSINGGAWTDALAAGTYVSVTSTSSGGSDCGPVEFTVAAKAALKDLPGTTTVGLRFLVWQSTGSNIRTLHFVTGTGSARTSRFGLEGFIEPSPTSLDMLVEKGIAAYSSGNIIYLSNLPEPATVYVYNVAGQLVAAQSVSAKNATLPIAQKGVYLIKVISANGIQTLKALNK